MYFEQFYLGCLAHASYLIVSGTEAAVFDPQRDVEIYLEAAKRHNATIRHVFETHLHADFVSGHRELAERTGAKIYIGPNGGATVPHVEVRDSFELRMGTVKIAVLETPGHTPESVCFLVTDEEKSKEPWAVLTGDTLFVGDVGRPDLSAAYSAPVLAGMLFDSLHSKLLTLRDDVIVYPGHGEGSLCGRKLGAAHSSTIRAERLTNYALQIKTRNDFIQQLTTNLPPCPAYFPQDAQINRSGAPALSDLPKPPAIEPQQLKDLIEAGVVAIDVRASEEFAQRHVPGSINIPLSGQFASWAGTLVDLKSRPVVIADTAEQLDEARTRLTRIGLDEERGYLKDGVKGWEHAGFESAALPQMTVQDLRERLKSKPAQVIDVRRNPEWQCAHVEGTSLYPLDGFKAELPPLKRDELVIVICKSGYRSSVACSMLQRAGYQKVTNVIGGVDAWQAAGFAVTRVPVI